MRTFNGPTIWSAKPVTWMVISLEGPDRAGTSSLQTVDDRFPELLAALTTAAASKTPLDPMPIRAGASIPELIAVLSINLQRLAGISVKFSTCRAGTRSSTHDVVFEHTDSAIGASAASLAVRMVNVLVGSEAESEAIDEYRTRFVPLVTARWNATTSQPIVALALDRGIPVQRIDNRGRVIELGNGKYRRRIVGSATSMMSALSEEISRDKAVTHSYLMAAGLPVAESGVAREVDSAIKIAERIGFPVVLKPADTGSARGVFLNLRTKEDVRNRFPTAAAESYSGRVLIERFLDGIDYRVTVVNGTLISIIETMPAHVLGDGGHSVAELVELVNADPKVGWRTMDTRRPITVDDKVVSYLAEQGRTFGYVPARGELVRLRSWPTMIDGGVSVDRTDDAHPDNVAILLQAAAVVGLDVTTMDVIAPDISQSIWETGGAILDVNAHSGFRMQRFPTIGQPRDPFPAIVDMLFPPEQPVRVPVVAVMGDQSAELCELLARDLAIGGQTVGLATGKRLVVGGMELKGVVRQGAAGIRTILNNPAVELAVAEVTAESIVEDGLGFGYCDVAIILSLSGLRTPFDRPVESVVTSLLASSGTLVLATDDPDLRALADDSPAQAVTVDRDDGQMWIDQILAEVRGRLMVRD